MTSEQKYAFPNGKWSIKRENGVLKVDKITPKLFITLLEYMFKKLN